MKYLTQFFWILCFSFLGEALHMALPFPIPASIYGMLLLFFALALHIVQLEQIRETGSLLVAVIAVLFIAPSVSLMDCWAQILPALAPILIIVAVSTLVTFGVSGGIVQIMLDRKKGGEKDG